MAILLCIETATTNCSVALSVNGSVIALKEDRSNRYSHAEQLHVFINLVLEEAGVGKEQLDAVVISKGPGSYTGLRIGVSAAKGLCYALDKPLVSVSTLRALAGQEKGTDFIIPMLDARRMEVYAAVFGAQYELLRETQAEIVDESSFEEYLQQGPTTFIGSGVEKFQKLVTHENAKYVKDAMPSASDLAPIAEEKFMKRDFEDVAYFEPYYLKDFVKG
ncbi:MAG TPA: tRNA (adenosine(37)-N6)-threonylcarbamoyltransferase complex dimerization subunit type 1 TsaB [Flavobacteriaceae bacterium]|jgi:tRNA threonylcarbamoyladenosine biosynthesis protein TsaB|nr:tRNA (adenosine(37)-N6)-threonylcarbamoyltransferase complex dimerization subunit type 1 TsaB [Flavobacteriaceae bacterium]HIN98796.1 tRNA (adenosine(37)-N6)-threonylcarbamoyltransferase complex dimerization subunit type 1 TsaB [Flavobacteriaceae bacterium]|tara:strand:- start:10262 stop:10918 length:657 start_codon:yes stop_codon:yes gene_type:complete